MMRLKSQVPLFITFLILVPLVRAQLAKIAIVDFEKAVVGSAEGKKSSEKFNITLQSKQAEAEKRQKELEEAQKRLQTQERTLNEAAKANLQKDIERHTTELQRFNEDTQKELQTLRDELLRPIAERASGALNAIAKEQGYTLIIDVSNPQNNVVWFNPKNDITDELIRRIDAEAPKTSEATKPPAAPAGRPATPPATPRATTPPPAAPRPATPSPAPTTPGRP
jgi:Skp family chaperone for outer membrane proteins